MRGTRIFELAKKALNEGLDSSDLYELASSPAQLWPIAMGIAGWIKNLRMGNSVWLCAIVNAKSGLCDQDCAFCAQAYANQTGSPVYPLISADKILELADEASHNRAAAFSIVTSGKTVSGRDFERILKMVGSLGGRFASICASLGCLEKSQLEELKAAGLRRYHHNLEASPSFYSKICATRPYEMNFRTLVWAKEAGLEACGGGIFGMGESWKDRVDLLMELKKADVDSLSLNFLIPIRGTPLETSKGVEPIEGLFCIALARLAHPKKHIIVCGGREDRLKDLQGAALISGASAMMIGNYLTQPGRDASLDLEMIADLGLVPEK